MGYIKIGNVYHNEDNLDKDAVTEYRAQEKFAAEDGFINKVKTFLGDGATLPRLANESSRYAQIRQEQEEARKKTAKEAGKKVWEASKEMVHPSYGYSDEQLASAKSSGWDSTKGVLKGIGRFATDIASLVPLGVSVLGSVTGSKKLTEAGAKLSEFPEAMKSMMTPSIKEAGSSRFVEAGLNLLPMGQVSKGKFLSKIAKLEDASKIEKLLISGKLVPKNLPAEDITKVAQSLTKIKDEKSILNTIYAESIFKKAELEIGKPLSTKAKMMVELSIKTTPITTPEEGQAFTKAIVEKIKSTIPPEKQIVKTVDTAGATIEKNAVGDVARIIRKDGTVSYESPELVKALELPEVKSPSPIQIPKESGKYSSELASTPNNKIEGTLDEFIERHAGEGKSSKITDKVNKDFYNEVYLPNEAKYGKESEFIVRKGSKESMEKLYRAYPDKTNFKIKITKDVPKGMEGIKQPEYGIVKKTIETDRVKLKTDQDAYLKQQLSDIYKQSKSPSPIQTDLISEAKKYKSAEEFAVARGNSEASKVRDEIISMYKKALPEISDEVASTNANRILQGLAGDSKSLSSFLHSGNKTARKIVSELTGKKWGKDINQTILKNGQGSLLGGVLEKRGITKSQLTDIWNKANGASKKITKEAADVKTPKTEKLTSVSIDKVKKTPEQIAKKEIIATEREAKQLAKNARQKVKFVKDLEKQIAKAAREENSEMVATLKAQKASAIKSANEAVATAKKAEAKMATKGLNKKQLSKIEKDIKAGKKEEDIVMESKFSKQVKELTYGQAYKSKKRLVSERTLLKEKFKNLTKGAKEGKKFGFKVVKDIKKKIHEYASDLPLEVRKGLLSKKYMQGLTSEKKLESALARIDKARNKFYKNTDRLEVLRDVLPLKKLAREKGLIGNVNMRVRSAFPRFKTIDGQKKLVPFTDAMVKGMSKDELIEYKKFLTEAMDMTPKKLDRTGLDWKAVPKGGSSKEIDLSKKGAKLIGQEIQKSIKGILGVVSTNIREIGGEKLFYKLRERTLELNRLSAKYAEKMKEFQTGIRKIQKSPDHTEIMDALLNQDFARAREIAKRNNFEDSLNGVISILEDIHARANAVGLKVGKLVDYFPRIVKDYDGLFAAINKKLGKEDRSFLDKLLSDAAKKKYKTVEELTEDERGDILTKVLRGYGEGKINIGSTGKARTIKEIPPEFLQYYHTPEDALTMYVSKMNDKITLKKLFGLDDVDQASIGSLIDGLKLTPDELHSLKQSLGAVLSPQGKENIILNKLRKSATLTLLSHISATLFQIADIGVSAYKHGGMRALGALFDAKPFKRDQLFTEILHEFSDSQAIKKSLKFVGFDRLDKLNSEAFMAAAFRKAGAEAKLGKGEKYNDLMAKLKPMFQGDEAKAKKVMDDLANQVVNKDTQFYVFNEILDVSPRALMEMPEAYLRNPNARMFYSMKSYGIKVLDIYRNDVIKKWKDNPKKSVKNFVKLTAFLTMSGATGSQVRDWYNGKDTKFSDNVINNLIQTMMVSTYDVNNVQRDGLGKVLLSKVLPPTRVFDDISKDLMSAGDEKGLYSLRDIPVVGGELYNRVGRGAESIAKANKENK